MSVTFQNFLQEGQPPLDSYFGGIGLSVLGRSTKRANFNRQFIAPNQKVILIDVSFNGLLQVAQNVPHLNTVISKGAEMFSNMEIKHVNKEGIEVENSEVIKLLNMPNPLQSMDQWLYDFYINFAVYSSNFGFKNYATSFSELPTTMWWLPPGWMKINATGKIYRQYKIEDIIESYTFIFDQSEFKPSEIIHICEGISQSKLTGASKIEALQLPLSNIVAALKSNNIILTERGMIGFIAGEKTGAQMPMIMNDDEKTRFRNQYQKNSSLDSENGHVEFTEAPLRWVPMVFDVKQLMLYEGLEDSFGQVCGAYGIDRDIFPSIKGATNENKEQGLKSTIQNTMQPLGNKLVGKLSNEFKLIEKSEKLVASWAHMPVMQEDALQTEQAYNQKVTGLSTLKRDGIISPQQYAELAEVDFDGTGISEQTNSQLTDITKTDKTKIPVKK